MTAEALDHIVHCMISACVDVCHEQGQTIAALEAKVAQLSNESEEANMRYIKLLQENVITLQRNENSENAT